MGLPPRLGSGQTQYNFYCEGRSGDAIIVGLYETGEVCTLDRCQGREAEYVFISLVRNRASVFLDSPKRWNVALTRAMQGLFIFGDIDNYLAEAKSRRHEASKRGYPRPLMSLLARILESYDRQIAGYPPERWKQ